MRLSPNQCLARLLVLCAFPFLASCSILSGITDSLSESVDSVQYKNNPSVPLLQIPDGIVTPQYDMRYARAGQQFKPATSVQLPKIHSQLISLSGIPALNVQSSLQQLHNKLHSSLDRVQMKPTNDKKNPTIINFNYQGHLIFGIGETAKDQGILTHLLYKTSDKYLAKQGHASFKLQKASNDQTILTVLNNKGQAYPEKTARHILQYVSATLSQN